MRPVILLDVDGVLNKVEMSKDPEGFGDFRKTRGGGYRLVYSPEMGRRLAALDADIYWLTTWCDSANEFIAPLFGWDEFPVLDSHYLDLDGWWKSADAAAFVNAEHRPFIWIDDDLYDAETKGEVPWLESCEVPNLCISPDTYRGLLPRHLDRIEAWIDDLKA